MQQIKRLSFFVIFLCTMLMLMMIISDIAARIYTVIQRKSLKSFFYTNQFYTIFQTPVQYTLVNPFLVIQPQTEYPFNEDGYRSMHSPFAPKADDEIRIFVMGGSTTANRSAKLSYAEVLEQRLQEQFPDIPIHCYNGGRSGYSSNQTLVRIATEVVFFKPDIITVMNTGNDLHELSFPGVQDELFVRNAKYFHSRYFLFINEHQTIPKIWWKRFIYHPLLNQHRALNILFDRLALRFEETWQVRQVVIPDVLLQRGVEEFRRNLTSMAGLAYSVNARMVYFSQPYNFDEDIYYRGYKNTPHSVNYPSFEQFIEGVKIYTWAIREVAAACEHCMYIPMHERFLEDFSATYFRDALHYTNRGIHKFVKLALDDMVQVVQQHLETRQGQAFSDQTDGRVTDDGRLFGRQIFVYEAESSPHNVGVTQEDADASNGRAIYADTTDSAGFLVYGPYHIYPSGKYTVNFRLKTDQIGADTPYAVIDVTTDNGETILTKRNVQGSEFQHSNTYQEFSILFSLDSLKTLEFRIYSLGKAAIWADNITVSMEKPFNPND